MSVLYIVCVRCVCGVRMHTARVLNTQHTRYQVAQKKVRLTIVIGTECGGGGMRLTLQLTQVEKKQVRLTLQLTQVVEKK